VVATAVFFNILENEYPEEPVPAPTEADVYDVWLLYLADNGAAAVCYPLYAQFL